MEMEGRTREAGQKGEKCECVKHPYFHMFSQYQVLQLLHRYPQFVQPLLIFRMCLRMIQYGLIWLPQLEPVTHYTAAPMQAIGGGLKPLPMARLLP